MPTPARAFSVLKLPTADDRWRFGTTNPAPGVNIQEGAHLGNWYPRIAFSGPIVRGRFLVFGCHQHPAHFDVVKQLPQTPHSNSGRATISSACNTSLVEAHFSRQLSLHRAYDTNLGLDALDPQSTTVTVEQRRAFVSMKESAMALRHARRTRVAGRRRRARLHAARHPALRFCSSNAPPATIFSACINADAACRPSAASPLPSRHWPRNPSTCCGRQRRRRGLFAICPTHGNPGTPHRRNSRSPIHFFPVLRISAFQYPRPVPTRRTPGAISKRFVFQAGLRTDWTASRKAPWPSRRASANFLPFADGPRQTLPRLGIYNAPLNLSAIGQAFDQQQPRLLLRSHGNGHRPRARPQPVHAFPLAACANRVSPFPAPAGNRSSPNQHPCRSRTPRPQRLSRFRFCRPATSAARRNFSSSSHAIVPHHFRAPRFFGEAPNSSPPTRSRAHSNEVLNPALGSIFYAPQQPGPVTSLGIPAAIACARHFLETAVNHILRRA